MFNAQPTDTVISRRFLWQFLCLDDNVDVAGQSVWAFLVSCLFWKFDIQLVLFNISNSKDFDNDND